MSSSLLLGVRLCPSEKMTVIKLNKINLEEKVEKLRSEIASQTNLSNDSFDLIYSGCLLEDQSTLESYGIKNGFMVHASKKKETNFNIACSSIPAELQVGERNTDILKSMFKYFVTNPLRPEVIEKIISSLNMDELPEGATAIALFQDPALMVQFKHTSTLKKAAKQRPAFFEAIHHVAYFLIKAGHFSLAPTRSVNVQTTENFQEVPRNWFQLPGLVLPLDRVSQTGNNDNSHDLTSDDHLPSNTNDHTNSQTNSHSYGAITPEMFDIAMQQAFSSIPNVYNPLHRAQSTPTFASPQNASTSNDMQQQIAIMNEMGLQNNRLNRAALQITNGNVETAIELVLNGFTDDGILFN